MSSPLTALPYKTNTGHSLTPLELAFILSFIECKNAAQAVQEAGYKSKRPSQYGIK